MPNSEYRRMRPIYDAKERELRDNASVFGPIEALADAIAWEAGCHKSAKSFADTLFQIAAELVVDYYEPSEEEISEQERDSADGMAEDQSEYDRLMDERGTA